ncbi:MAG: pilus assembly protein PilM [Candidatus Babeliaceae bacterium]
MIRNIFIPEVIKSYYIISQRIIGFDFNKNILYATVIKAKGNKRTIEKCIEEAIITDPNLEYADRVAQTIKKIMDAAGPIDKVYSAFPSSLAIIKELEIPFKGLEKIKMLLPFEIEPLLPFPLQQAVLDCIITSTSENKTQVLVAAVKKQHIDEHINLFLKAGITPQKITLDLFELYGLYHSIPYYAHLSGTIGVIDIGMHTTRLLAIVNGKLIGLRTLAKGLMSLTKNAHESHNEMREQLMRFGFQQTQESVIESFLNEIQFSLQAAITKKDISQKYDKLLIAGVAAQIPNIEETITSILHTPAEIFNIRKIIHNNTVQAHNIAIPSSCAISLATALSSPLTASFNLATFQTITDTDKKLLFQQIIVAGILSLILIGAMIIYSLLSLSRFQSEAESSEQQALNQLKKEFTLATGKKGAVGKGLDSVLKAAQADLAKKEAGWFSLSAYKRATIVKALAELSGHIDREGLGLLLKKLVFKMGLQDTISIEGSVKDYDALNNFEEALRMTNLFENVPKFQDLKFNITLILKKSEQQS